MAPLKSLPLVLAEGGRGSSLKLSASLFFFKSNTKAIKLYFVATCVQPTDIRPEKLKHY